jgi:hypothetical protein
MANGNDERHNPKRKVGKEDFLSEHGMTPDQQFVAERHAAAVPASDFEGYYPMPGYNYPGAQRLQRILWESRMRKATGIPKVNDMPEDTDKDETL